MHDTSELVMHARKTVFAMLLTSAVVVFGIFSEDPMRLTRAYDQVRVVDGLVKHWGTVSSGTVRSLARLLAGPATPPTLRGTYKVTLVPLDADQGATSALGGDSVDALQCTLRLDVSNYLFVTDNNYEPVHLSLRGTSVVRSELSGGVERDAYPSIDGSDLGLSAPEDLSGFVGVWDWLAATPRAARVVAVAPEDGFAHARQEGSRGAIYSVAAGAPPIDRNGIGVRATAVLSLADLEGYQNAVLNRWRAERMVHLIAGECRPEGIRSEAVIIMPATLYSEQFDWTRAWIQQAIASGHLGPTAHVESQPFESAFRDLQREASGLESLDIGRLRLWLENRTNEERQSIVVLGIAFTSNHLRVFGVLFIVVLQAYATLHLAAVRERIAQGPGQDPGAFKPWVLLYEDAPARIGAYGMVAAPTLAASAIVARLWWDGQVMSAVGTIAVAGTAVSVCLTCRGVWLAGETCRKAQTHRAAFGAL